MEKLYDLIAGNEEWLMDRVLSYAEEHGYVKYTSTLREDWRISIAGVSATMLDYLQQHQASVPELKPDEDYSNDPASTFGIDQAMKHRRRGVNLSMYLGMLKYYRQSYLDLVCEARFDKQTEEWCRLFIERFFDRMEIAICQSWAGSSQLVLNEQLINPQQLEDIIELLPDPTFAIDQDKKVIAWNRAMEQMTGVYKKEIIGQGDYAYAVPFFGKPQPVLIDLIDRIDKVKSSGRIDRNNIIDWIDRIDQIKQIDKADVSDAWTPYSLSYHHVKSGWGKIFAEFFAPSLYQGKGAMIWATASPLFDRSSNVVGAIETIRDITERKKMEKQLKYLSLHDSLTGLYNRTFFEREIALIEKKIAKNSNGSIGVIVCDVDGLKQANDTLGHDAGDRLLLAATRVIESCFRENDIIARIGGDEFAVLLQNCEGAFMESACRRIQDAVDLYNRINPDLPLSISAGFSIWTAKGQSINDIFKEADNNMYRKKLHHKRSARYSIVQTLKKALEARDFITEGHADRLQGLVDGLAATLGLPERSVTDLRLLAQFHDIGKVGIPDRILYKPGPLTTEEAGEMQRHCEIGRRIALSAPELMPIADWILKHHEWWNGRGYPLKLKEDQIPLECRILAIADAFDAMTSDRPYRKAMPRAEAISELKRCAGTQFDPMLVQVFIDYLTNQSNQKKVHKVSVIAQKSREKATS